MKKNLTQLLKTHKKHIKQCEKSLGISFKKKILLLEAISHKSAAGTRDIPRHFFNERLEFLGDSVLGLIITEHLFTKYPDKNEGILTKIRSKLIRRETLAGIGKRSGLGGMLLLGGSEQKMGARGNPALLSNCVEALIGAYYLDSSFRKTKKFVLSLYKDLLAKELHDLPVFEYKNKLQEYTQSKFGKSPDYRVISSEGPEHNKMFTSEVLIEGNGLGCGTGKSKKESETNAAKAALKHLHEENQK